MNEHIPAQGSPEGSTWPTAGVHAKLLRSKLRDLATGLFPPRSEKTLRRFTATETARIIGVSDGRLRQLAVEDATPTPETDSRGRRNYSLADIHALRAHLDKIDRVKRRYKPWREGEEHLQVIACVNFKGGSGKTTTAAHLAQSLVLRGYRVLAIDLDPQASLSALLGVQPESKEVPYKTIYDAVRYDALKVPMREVIRQTYFTGLDLVPADLELEVFEFEAPMESARRQHSKPEAPFFARMSLALDEVRDDYDVVVVDCPPRLGYLTIAALCTATSVLVTIHPQMLDVSSMQQFLTMLDEMMEPVRNQGGMPEHDWFRYIVTRFEPGDVPQQQVVGMLRQLFPNHVLSKAMLKSAAVSDAGLSRQTLFEVPLRRGEVTRSTYDRALEALEAVNGEIEALICRAWGRK